MFEALGGDATVDPASPRRVLFHPTSGIDEAPVAQVQAAVRTRILRAFAGRGLIERIAALVPPSRTHRHRYYGVLASNSPLRSAVTAMAQAGPAQVAVGQSGTAEGGTGEGAPGLGLPGNALGGGGAAPVVQAFQAPAPEPPRRFPAHYLWAVLIARNYEVFPLVCPQCGGNMRLIAFITEGVRIRRILEYIGVDTQAPRIASARGPPLWDECDAQGADAVALGEGTRLEPDWGEAAQMAPDDRLDQRTD